MRATAALRLVNFFTAFQVVEGRDARKTIPGFDQAGRRPLRGELGQFLRVGKRFFAASREAGERHDVVGQSRL